ncbi:MAG TPA: GAF domain-containing protein, partial [Candidatus Limnocylindrales bacterium]
MTTQLEPAFAFFGSAGTDLAALLQRAVRQTARMLDASGAMIYLYDGERDRLRWAYDAGISDERELAWVRALEIPIGVGLFGRAVAEDRLMVSDDYSADRRFRHAPDLDRFVREVGVRSMIVAPMVGADGPLGAIGAYARRTGAFGEPEMALIGALAGHGAIAIENARLIERLRASQDELSRRAAAEHALREIAAGITAIRDPAEIRQRVADESRRLLAVDGAHLALLDEGVLHSAVV